MDAYLHGGSSFWDVADDEKFWLDGLSSDEEVEEMGDVPFGFDSHSKMQSTKRAKTDSTPTIKMVDTNDSLGNDSDDLSSSEDLVDDRQATVAKKGRLPQWERKWRDKFDKMERALPRPAKKTTEAILSCPGCFTVLCKYCQAHATIFNRWRVFESNANLQALEVTKDCTVNAAVLSEGGDSYRVVECTHCGAEVGAFDSDNVYHFYYAIPSRPS